MAQIHIFFSFISNNWRIIYESAFQKGLIAGALLIVIVIILLRLFTYLFIRRNVKYNGVTGKNESGEVFVSSAAISDLVKSLESEFVGVHIAKTILFKKGRIFNIRLIAELNDKDIDFPNLVENIRSKIFFAIKNNLGVDAIQKIDIHLKRVKG